MSTIKALVPYRTETFRPHPAQPAGARQDNASAQQPAREASQKPAKAAAPARFTPFLVQLMVGVESDLRRNIGRSDIAEARQNAYGAALANRPSAEGLRYLRALGKA